MKQVGLCDGTSFGIWRLTERGKTYVAQHPQSLSDRELSELIDQAKTTETIDWQDRLTRFRQEPRWQSELDEESSQRAEALPELREFLASFLAGAVDFERFRAMVNERSRTSWAAFGLKGPTVALVLNQLAKVDSDVSRAESEVRSLLGAPTDETNATAKLLAFARYFDDLKSGQIDGANALQIGRIRVFASVFWNVQDERWPVCWPSARATLIENAVYDASAMNVAEDYLVYREEFERLRGQLAVGQLEFARVLGRLRSGAAENRGASTEDDEASTPASDTWLIALGEGASAWDDCKARGVIAIGWRELGDLSTYTTQAAISAQLQANAGTGKKPMHDALACWQFARTMQIGDRVFVKRGTTHVIAEGVVTSDYRYEGSGRMPNVRDVRWEREGEWLIGDRSLVTKTLTRITGNADLLGSIDRASAAPGTTPGRPRAEQTRRYVLEDAAVDLFIPKTALTRLFESWREEKNLILQGPPGVGKTFVADRLARAMIGSDDDLVAAERIKRVQFHPSYSYEDFIQGLRPDRDGKFRVVEGPFLRFCRTAMEDDANPYVFVIDEINRANLSKVFGEALSLIEENKRHQRYALTLPYTSAAESEGSTDDETFFVPPNVFIIGTMNTADRSLSLVDYALRRRFLFEDVPAAFETKEFADFLVKRNVQANVVERIRTQFRELNDAIRKDPTLGDGFVVGHSYFDKLAGTQAEQQVGAIIERKIAPLLREYWFDKVEKASEWIQRLRQAWP